MTVHKFTVRLHTSETGHVDGFISKLSVRSRNGAGVGYRGINVIRSS